VLISVQSRTHELCFSFNRKLFTYYHKYRSILIPKPCGPRPLIRNAFVTISVACSTRMGENQIGQSDTVSDNSLSWQVKCDLTSKFNRPHATPQQRSNIHIETHRYAQTTSMGCLLSSDALSRAYPCSL
jgi:hypothetical protein